MSYKTFFSGSSIQAFLAAFVLTLPVFAAYIYLDARAKQEIHIASRLSQWDIRMASRGSATPVSVSEERLLASWQRTLTACAAPAAAGQESLDEVERRCVLKVLDNMQVWDAVVAEKTIVWLKDQGFLLPKEYLSQPS